MAKNNPRVIAEARRQIAAERAERRRVYTSVQIRNAVVRPGKPEPEREGSGSCSRW